MKNLHEILMPIQESLNSSISLFGNKIFQNNNPCLVLMLKHFLVPMDYAVFLGLATLIDTFCWNETQRLSSQL